MRYIKNLDDEYHRYVAHLMRKHRSSKIQMLLSASMDEMETFLWIDYKAKPLSMKNREGQTEAFGKKGLSLFGLATMFRIPSHWTGQLPIDTEREGDMLIHHVRVACDDSDQSCWHSAQVPTTALLLLKAQYPWLEFGNLYSDGATNFKSILFTVMLLNISLRTGSHISAYLLPEACDGKDMCDRDFAGINRLFQLWPR